MTTEGTELKQIKQLTHRVQVIIYPFVWFVLLSLFSSPPQARFSSLSHDGLRLLKKGTERTIRSADGRAHTSEAPFDSHTRHFIIPHPVMLSHADSMSFFPHRSPARDAEFASVLSPSTTAASSPASSTLPTHERNNSSEEQKLYERIEEQVELLDKKRLMLQQLVS